MVDRRLAERRATAPDIEALYLRVAAARDRRTTDRRIAAPHVEPAASRWRARAGLVFIVILLGLAGSSDRATAAGSGACAEGMACWTWPLHGNYKRGITTVGERHLVVGPCRYQRIALAERIDWRLTPNLRGDALATFAGCRMTADRARGRSARWRG